MNIVEPAIERYIESLREPLVPPGTSSSRREGRGAVETVRREMEERAREGRFPIVGPEVGRLLFALARSSGARRILELGSGFGYSALWFARALPVEGEIHLTDSSEENRGLAERWLDRAGLRPHIVFHLGDALALLEQVEGPFDIIFNDVDKDQYPSTIPLVLPLLRSGGLFITDNVLWKGRVAAATEGDETTVAIRRFNQQLVDHPELETAILPLRDGLTLSVKR